MLESLLKRKNAALPLKVTVKAIVSAVIIALAVALPLLVHAAAGAEGGMKYMPMYLPVLLGGCLLGTGWGLGVGITAPLTSFVLTSAASSPMPSAERLPFMTVELAVFAAVSGIFSGKIVRSAWYSFAAAAAAFVAGRATFLLLAAIFGGWALPITPAVVSGQIAAGLPGAVLLVVIVPIAVILLNALLGEKRK